jgi:hypothetical protein
VIIHNFYVEGIALAPHEAHSELIIHADAVLAGAVAAQSFQLISRRHFQVSSATAAFRIASFLNARNCTSKGSRRFLPDRHNLSVSLSRKLAII